MAIYKAEQATAVQTSSFKESSSLWDKNQRWLPLTTVILLWAAFTWWSTTGIQYLETGAGSAQIIFRVVPLLTVGIISLRTDIRQGLAGFSRMFRWPALAFVWYIGVSIIGGMTSLLPRLALWKAAEMLVVVYWGCCISSYILGLDLKRRVLEWSVLVLFVVLLWVLLRAAVNPSQGFGQYGGAIPQIHSTFPFINPNSLGMMAAVTLYAIFCGLLFSQSRLWRILGFLISLYFFVVAQSRTAYIALFVVLAIGVFERVKAFGGNNLVILAAGCFSGAAIIACNQLIIARVFLMKGRDKLLDLSGRVGRWEAIPAFIRLRPLFGGGLGTGSRFLPLFDPSSFVKKQGLGSVENMPLEVVLSAGYVGAIPLLVSYALILGRAVLHLVTSPIPVMFSPKGFWIGLILMLFIRSMTSAALALYNFEFVLFILALATEHIL